ncbi:hypothetical protein PENTCL1PPCAC_28109, partial [Pristionchus entomophagus]
NGTSLLDCLLAKNRNSKPQDAIRLLDVEEFRKKTATKARKKYEQVAEIKDGLSNLSASSSSSHRPVIYRILMPSRIPWLL